MNIKNYHKIVFNTTFLVDLIVPIVYLILWFSFFKDDKIEKLILITICTVFYFYKIVNLKKILKIKNKEIYNLTINTANFLITFSIFFAIQHQNIFYIAVTLILNIIATKFILNLNNNS